MERTFKRGSAIQRLRRKLERDGYPRLQMFLLVAITGGTGFLASFTLLHFGLDTMWLRYLAALGCAYAVFLFLLWLWLRTRAEDYADLPDLSDLAPRRGSRSADCHKDAPAPQGSTHDLLNSGPDTDFPGGEALDAISGADELALPLAALALVAALAFSSLWVIYTAPVLFAELLVDGVLAASLYRRLRVRETRHWLETALRRTVWPFALTVLIVTGSGWAMQHYAPEAHSIGEAVAHWKDLT